jgi:hypothetical protein
LNLTFPQDDLQFDDYIFRLELVAELDLRLVGLCHSSHVRRHYR